MYIDAIIDVTGPGLVVNGPAIVLIKALKDIGFEVEYEDWLGKDQYDETQEEILNNVKSYAKSAKIKVIVHPQPWGA
jgi:hypothetical protein